MPVKQAKGEKGTADKYFSMAIRSIGHCEKCGTSQGLTCSHIISRKYNATRCSFRNAHCLCFSCHQYFGDNPILFAEWVMSTWAAEYILSEREKLHNTKPIVDWKQRTEISKAILNGSITLKEVREQDL